MYYSIVIIKIFCTLFSAQGQQLIKTSDLAQGRERILFENFNINVTSAQKTPLTFEQQTFDLIGLATHETDQSMLVSWIPAAWTSIFRHDAGIIDNGLSFTNAGPRAILGVVFKDIRQLAKISYMLYSNNPAGEARTINILVYALNSEGKPINTLLYKKEGIKIKSSMTLVYDLAPIQTPNGCFISIGAADNLPLGLGMDKPNDEWPFVAGVNYSCQDYLSGMFTSITPQMIGNNLAIRCYGTEDNHPNEVVDNFKVWRLEQGQEENKDQWNLLTASPINAAEFEDLVYATLPSNIYKYAVCKITGTEDGSIQFTNPVYKNMHTKVALKVVSELESLKLQDVTVSLEGIGGFTKDLLYVTNVERNDSAVFEGIIKGNYTLKIEKYGFVTIEEAVDLSVANEYELGTRMLIEYKDKPWRLLAEQTAEPMSRKISWNAIKIILDDVEGHSNFALNSAGTIGWSYIDADGGIPYGINNCEFPNMNKPCAYMAFNPSLTTPTLTNLPNAIAHSGQKYFAAFANMPAGQGQESIRNNDYIISPLLEFTSDMRLSFWAKSYASQYMEEFKVLYSTTGKQQIDFTKVVTTYTVVAPANWTNFTYHIPQEAQYIAIVYTSKDQFIFMIDDISIAEAKSLAIPTMFEISLDGGDIIETDSLSALFSNLTPGEHSVSIKAIYLTGNSESTELSFVVDDIVASVNGKLIDEEGGVISDARIMLNGNYLYKTTSSDSGEFTVGSIQGNAEYNLSIEANGYATYNAKVNVANAMLNLGDIVMKTLPLPPGGVIASESQDRTEINVVWKSPRDYKLFRRDDGRMAGGMGSTVGTDKTVIGAVHVTPTELYNISWVTAVQGNNTINVFVFDLDSKGRPTKKILFERKDVENIGMTLNTLHFDKPLKCPSGFLIGISASQKGNVGLGADSGMDSIWRFTSKTNYIITDYTKPSDAFVSLDQQFARNLLIRAEGSATYPVAAKNTQSVIAGYKIYRFLKDNLSDTSKWVVLSQQLLTEEAFVDGQWNTLPKGIYQYAIKCVYNSGEISTFAYSNKIAKNMFTTVKVNVQDEANLPVKIANISLIPEESAAITAITDTTGEALLENINTGKYRLVIEKDGYADFEVNNLDFSTELFYNIGPYTLTDVITAPTALRIEEVSLPTQRVLYWEYLDETAETTNEDFYFVCETKSSITIYEVFLNNIKIGETAEKTFRLVDLSNKNHVVGVRVRKGFSYSDMATLRFKVDNSASNEDIATSDISIYPNPVQGYEFNIKDPEGIVKAVAIVDLQGKTMKTILNNTAGDVLTVYVHDTVKGLCIVKIQTTKGQIFKKILFIK